VKAEAVKNTIPSKRPAPPAKSMNLNIKQDFDYVFAILTTSKDTFDFLVGFSGSMA
jgi:hypothetical protein